MSKNNLTVYVVRHGETDENAKGILCGQRIDNSINDRGREQARDTAAELSKLNIYSSTMKRAVETAHIIAEECHKKVAFDDRLRERDYGSLSGKTWEENFGSKAAEKRRQDVEQEYDYRPYGGESALQVLERLLNFLDDIKSSHDQPIVIVAHGGVLKSLKKHFDGLAYEATPDNGSILTLSLERNP